MRTIVRRSLARAIRHYRSTPSGSSERMFASGRVYQAERVAILLGFIDRPVYALTVVTT